MEETVMPPSPNWLPQIMSSREDGSVGFGAGNSVVVLKPNLSGNFETLVINNAHDYRITSVSFPPTQVDTSLENTIVSCSDDGYVKLWKIESSSATIGHKCHWDGYDSPPRVIGIDWSHANSQHVVSIAENNSVVLWNVLTNTTTRYHFPKLSPTVLSCSLNDEKIAGVGTKSGLVYVLDLRDKGQVLFRLRGHDNEIQSLSWCPADYNVFEADFTKKESLLASVCKDKSIYIWKAKTDGRCDTAMKLPTNPVSKQTQDQYVPKSGNSNSCVTVFWSEPNVLYVTDSFGELVYFDIKCYIESTKSEEVSKKKLKECFKTCLKLAHSVHSRPIVAIAGLQSNRNFRLSGEVSEKEKPTDSQVTEEKKLTTSKPSIGLIWTTGLDKKLVAFQNNGDEVEIVHNLSTIYGYVYNAVVSPFDANLIAIAVGDGVIRLWNLTEPCGNIKLFWQKVKDRVMALAWHPKKEGILAYGTSEGRVGLYDVLSTKMPVVFKPGNPQPIYWLSWGPAFRKTDEQTSLNEDDFALYSVSDSTISQYIPSKPGAEPVNISRAIDFPCKKQTDVCWKPDYSLLAIGNEDGSICLLKPPKLNIVLTIPIYNKLIQSISWHPISTSLDSGISPYHGYVTSGSTDRSNEIRVFNCKQNGEVVVAEKVAVLTGHLGFVQHVSWSPHIGGRLVSTSSDCSVQVWDVLTQAPLVNFVPSSDQMSLFSIWSPVDPDLIISGCRNRMLCVWRISTKSDLLPSNVPKPKKAKMQDLKLSKMVQETAGKDEKRKETKEKPVKKAEPKENGEIVLAKPKEGTKTVKEMKMFAKAWKGESEELNNCYQLMKEEVGDQAKPFRLGFLNNEKDWTEIINVEEQTQNKSNNWSELYELATWKGNLKELIEEKMKSNQLDDFLVSLSPMVSPRIWQEACLSYSKNLVEKKQYRKAATYLTVCHKVEEAIQLLVDSDLYLEALCLLRCRFPDDETKVKEIVTEYADWLEKHGQIFKACECYIYLKDYLKVAGILSKKTHAEHLTIAALAAKKGGDSKLEVSNANVALVKSLGLHNWDLARSICEDHSQLKHLKLLYDIFNVINQLDLGKLTIEDDICTHVKNMNKIDDNESIELYDNLKYVYDKRIFYKDKNEMLLCVVRELSLAICSQDKDVQLTHLIKCLSACSRYLAKPEEGEHPLYKLCTWLAPKGFLADGSIFNDRDSTFSSKTSSLRSFLCEGIIDYLNNKEPNQELARLIPVLKIVLEDLMAPENFKYFKDQIEVKTYEKKLMDSYVILQSKNGKSGQNGKNGEENEAEEVENEADSKELSQRAKDVEILNKLKNGITKFEFFRISCPNPVVSYCRLRNICSKFSSYEVAKDLLEEAELKWSQLN